MNVFDMLITQPLGYIISFIYSLVQNYGLAIIVFTIVVKIIMLPLMVKQQKSMAGMQKIQPELEKLQKKYANDKTRLNEETVKLYQKHNVSPVGGCLPLLIQLPIIFALYNVIQNPVEYIMHFDDSQISAIKSLLDFQGSGIALANEMANNVELLISNGFEFSPIMFKFVGLDLSMTPNFKVPDLIWVIPILSAVTSYLSTWVSTKMSGNQSQNQQMASMNVIMPLFSAVICFGLPAGVGLYWVMSNVVQIVLQYFVTVTLKKKEEKANAEN